MQNNPSSLNRNKGISVILNKFKVVAATAVLEDDEEEEDDDEEDEEEDDGEEGEEARTVSRSSTLTPSCR